MSDGNYLCLSAHVRACKIFNPGEAGVKVPAALIVNKIPAFGTAGCVPTALIVNKVPAFGTAGCVPTITCCTCKFR